MISPEVLADEMERVERACRELATMAKVVRVTYAELYDASLTPMGRGSALETPISRGDFSASDPTGETALSGAHRKMRWRCRQAARQMRQIRPLLERVENDLLDGFLETDPELRERLRLEHEERPR